MKKISKKSGTVLFHFLLGGVFPVLFFLLGWWGSIGRVGEDKIFLVAFAGLLWGVLLNFLVLKRILTHLYFLPLWLLAILYVFYSFCLYGFFMGFPLFNLFLGIPAGLYMGYRKNEPKQETKNSHRPTSIFTSLIMLILCLITIFLVLKEKTFGNELKSMFNLSFLVTKPMLLSFMVVGTIAFVVLQYWLTGYYFNKGE